MGRRRSVKQGSWSVNAHTDAEGIGDIRLTLTASKPFYDKAALTDCPAAPQDLHGDSIDGGTTTLSLENGAILDRLIAWFREGSDGDPNATLAFPASLSKFDRARVHSLVKSVGLGSLQSVSRGIGDNRYISIEHSRIEDQSGLFHLTTAQQHKSFWIYRWAKGAGVSVSRDEVSEMLLSNALTAQLEQLWKEGSAQQKLIIKLCEAVVEGDAAVFKVLQICKAGVTNRFLGPDMAMQDTVSGAYRQGLKSSFQDQIMPGPTQDMLASDEVLAIVRSGQYDLLSGEGVLHCAAREGHTDILESLIGAGAPIDAQDGHGLTALQVSRQHPEQCEAESILLRAGALDTISSEIPVLLSSTSEEATT